MSTEHRPSDPSTGRWRLDGRVALRPEPFGALAYHYGNRRLSVLRSTELVRLVGQLEHFDTPRDAFDGLDLDPGRWPVYGRALDALARSDVLERLGRADASAAVGNDDER